MRDVYGAKTERAQWLRFHTQTAGVSLTAQQPDNNIVRVAMQALAAVLGGTQSLHCNGKDEALALPTEESATIALRTQQIILHESGVANTVDPVAGAYAVEEMTDRIEAEARTLMDRIEAIGGTLVAIESGFIQRQIQDAAYAAQRAIDAGESVVVGVNRFIAPQPARNAGSTTADLFRIDPEIERQQIARVRAVRAGRSDQEWRAALEAVERAARGGDNLVPVIITAVEKFATLGEVADTLRRAFGEYQDVSEK
jgi:methylmalonyl-CoA mutase N-terminal domain/subunit